MSRSKENHTDGRNQRRLGPAQEESWTVKPLQLNEFVYLLPSTKNQCLKNFLSKLPNGITAVRELSSSSPDGICLEGKGVWYSKLSKPDDPKYCISIKDFNCPTQVKLYLEGQAACGECELVSARTISKHIFAYRSMLSPNEDFETQTEDSEVTLTIDGSDPRMCCIFIHRWLYKQLEKGHPTAVVESLPDPLGSACVTENVNAEVSHQPRHKHPPSSSRVVSPSCTSASNSSTNRDRSPHSHRTSKAVTIATLKALSSSSEEYSFPSGKTSFPHTSTSKQDANRNSPHKLPGPFISTEESSIPAGEQGSQFGKHSTPSRSRSKSPFPTSTSDTGTIRDRSPHGPPVNSTSTVVTAIPVRAQSPLHGKLLYSFNDRSPPHSSTSNLDTTRDHPPPHASPGGPSSLQLPAAQIRAQGSKGTCSKHVSQSEYTYTKLTGLSDLREEVRVNVAGVVKRFRSCYRTRGTDYCCSFSLVDQSLSSGVTCIIFNKHESKLPQITRVGEIVVIRRMKVNFFNGVPQLIGAHFSSFHVFDGESDTKLQPRHSSAAASLSDMECHMVKSLQEMVSMSTELNSQARICTLENVDPAVHFDIIAQVVSILTIANGLCVFLSICDGTEFPHCSSRYSTQCFQTQMELDKTLVKNYEGWIVDVLIYDSCVTKLINVIPGCFVYLHDVVACPLYGKDSSGKQCVVVELSAQGIDCPDFSCAVLDTNDRDVAKVQSRLLALSRTNKHNPGVDVVRCLVPSVTICLHPNRPFTSVADILVCSQVPNMFRCDLRAVRIFPKEITGLVQLCCQRCGFEVPLPSTTEEEGSGMFSNPGSVCPKCAETCSAEELSYRELQKKTFSDIERELFVAGRARDAEDETNMQHASPLLAYTYIFKLVMEDDSGCLEAFVAEKDATLFLENLLPTNLHLCFESRLALWKRLKYLFGQNPFDLSDTTAIAPRMDCCILSYYTSSSETSSAEVAFRICHTILPAPSDI